MVPQGPRTVTGPRPRTPAGKEGNRLGKKERKSRSETKRKGGGEKTGARKEGRQERQGEMAGGGKRCTLRGWGAAVAALLEGPPPPPGGHYLPAPLAGNTAASKGSQILGITLTTILQGRKEGLSRPRKLFKCTPLSSDGVRIQTLLLHAASGRI